MKPITLPKITILLFLYISGTLNLYGAEELPEEAASPQAALLLASAKEGDLRQFLRRIRAGDDPNQTDDQGRTPLMFAVQQAPHIAGVMIRQLLQHHADSNAVDKSGYTALAHAVIAQKPQAVRQLLAHGAHPTIPESILVPEPIKQILEEHQKEEGEEKEEEGVPRIIDPITHDDITRLDENKRITIGPNTYAKSSILAHIINQLGVTKLNTETQKEEPILLDEIRDPVSRVLIGRETIIALATDAGIPIAQLETPKNFDSIQQIPGRIDELTYYRLQQHLPNILLPLYRAMIADDTLRTLSYRLQKLESNIQLHPEGHSVWNPGEYQWTQRQIESIKQIIKERLKQYKQPPQPPAEPFFRMYDIREDNGS